MKTNSVGRGARSIDEFCAAYRISRPTFYNLQKAGKAPDTLKIGSRRLITDASCEAWERAMAQASAPKVMA